MSSMIDLLKKRRSIYAINKEIPVSQERIEEIVGQAVKYVPSSFNSQSARVLILFDEQHDKFWDLTKETLRKVVPEGQFASTEAKMESFRSGRGTILFFEEQAIIEGLQQQFALYADNFPVWSEQSSGMLQLAVWVGLADEGVGATLQHYNPLVDEQVAKEWNVPSSWKLIGQMPFGGITAPAGDKEFAPLEARVRVAK